LLSHLHQNKLKTLGICVISLICC